MKENSSVAVEIMKNAAWRSMRNLGDKEEYRMPSGTEKKTGKRWETNGNSVVKVGNVISSACSFGRRLGRVKKKKLVGGVQGVLILAFRNFYRPARTRWSLLF